MQLLQNYELVSWKLPKYWQIVLTANPDGGDYSVTPMDNAMLTRMMHITLNFDSKTWALWAEKSGIDSRCINFVLTYPEIALGERTTPRSLVQFFQSIENISDFNKALPLIQMLGSSCLDEETIISFITFIQQNLSILVKPEEILATKNFKNNIYKPIKGIVKQKDKLRVDILATLCTRLINYLNINNTQPTENEVKNIQNFIKMDFLPNDLRLGLIQDIVTNPNLNLIMSDPEVAILLLDKM